MRVLVCGGRDYDDRERVFRELDALHEKTPITALIEGGANGADRHAHEWATSRTVLCRTFHADWKEYGKAAGPIRNQRMIDAGKPDLVVAFPGHEGTEDMVSRARWAGLKVMEIAP